MNFFKYCIRLLVLLSISIIHSQTVIKGTLKDNLDEPIISANITLEDSNKKIVSYTYTDDLGKYTLKIEKFGNFNLVAKSMGFEQKNIEILIEQKSETKTIDFKLSPKVTELKEIVIETKNRSVIIKKDTIIINAKSFAKGNETVVEDLLRKLPGINVDEDGKIKIGNQEIEKVMVEGDDFFERGYKLLTKNMNANTIDKVEIYQKYSNNRLLKGIEKSDKVALNLRLKKDIQMQWFGNTSLGYGVVAENRYEARTNLMSFGKKAKYYLISNLNNTGYDATGDINQLVRPFRMDDVANFGDDEMTSSLLSMNTSKPSLKDERTNFNNAELLSINAIFTVSPKLKMKTLGFFNWDENDFFRNGFQSYKLGSSNFVNTEEYVLQKKKIIGFGKLDFIYDISKTKMLELTSKYNNEKDNSESKLLFNLSPTIEQLKENNELIDQKLIFTNKLSEKKVYVLSGRYINEKSPQEYNNDNFFFSSLFPANALANKTIQTSQNKMQFAGLDVHVLDRKDNGNLLEWQTGYKFRQDFLKTQLSFEENNQQTLASSDYANNAKYNTSDIYFNTKYLYKRKKYGLVAEIDIHQLFNQYTNEGINQNQNPFFVNPKIGMNWELNKNNKVTISYSYNKTNAKILDIYSNNVLTGYRNFDKGVNHLNQLQASTLFFNYGLGNWGSKFFANATVIFTKDHDFYSTNSVVTPNYSLTEKTIIKNREMLSISTNADYFMKFMSSNLKLNLNYSKSNYKNIVNSTDLREVNSNTYMLGTELRSGFKGFFNYHIGTKWTANEIKTSIVNKSNTNISFLDLSFGFGKKLNLDIQSERYFFSNLDKDNNKYYFLDIESKYTVKDNKLSFTLSGKNLFNTKTFTEYYVSDLAISSTQYRLLPRYVMLKIDYRF